MNQRERERRKPRGTSFTFHTGPQGISREQNQLPAGKAGIEQHFAELFCSDCRGMRSHFKRFGKFENLHAQQENDIDFKVETDEGAKWLELAEFAPIEKAGRYDDASGKWEGHTMADLFVELVRQKNRKGYGSGVILMVYATHDRFWVPPTVVRTMPERLKDEALVFEAVYMVSPNGTVMEAWPGDPDNQGPQSLGRTIVGPFSGTEPI